MIPPGTAHSPVLGLRGPASSPVSRNCESVCGGAARSAAGEAASTAAKARGCEDGFGGTARTGELAGSRSPWRGPASSPVFALRDPDALVEFLSQELRPAGSVSAQGASAASRTRGPAPRPVPAGLEAKNVLRPGERRNEVAHLRRMLRVPRGRGDRQSGRSPLACKQKNMLCFATVRGETRSRGFLDDSGTGSAASPLRPAGKKGKFCFAVARGETRLRACAGGFGLLETRGPAIRLVPAGLKNCFA